MTETLLSNHQKKVMARNSAIYERWLELTANPANPRMEIYKLICSEFGLEAPSTIWTIVKRMEKQYNGHTRRKE